MASNSARAAQRRKEIWEYMVAHLEEHGVVPTIRKIAEVHEISTSHVFFILRRLIKFGWVERHEIPGEKRPSRTYFPVEGGDDACFTP